MQIANPEDWAEFAKTAAAKEIVRRPGLDSIIDRLRSIDPTHNLVELYDQWKSDPAIVRTKIKRAVATRLTMELGEITLTPVTKQRQAAEAHITGLKVNYVVNGKFTESRALAAALGIAEHQIDEILANFKLNPAAAKQILTYLAYKECVDSDQRITREQERPTSFIGTEGYQEKILPKNSEYLAKQFGRLVLIGVGGTVGGLLLGMGASLYMDNRYESVEQTAKKAAAVELGLDPENAYVEQKDIDLTMRRWSVFNGFWQGWRDIRRAMAETVDFRPDLSSGQEAGDGSQMNYHGVGNVESGQDQVQWRISGVNSMETDGYWWEDTSTALVSAPSPKDPRSSNLYWFAELTPGAIGNIQLAEQKPVGAYIEVEKQLGANDFKQVIAAKPTFYDNYRFVQVPIKAGTVLAGATLDGRPVMVAERSNGLRMIAVLAGTELSGHLKYWLAPVQDETPGPYIGPNDISFYSGEVSGSDYADIMDSWERLVPGIGALSPERQFSLMYSYIRSFEYEFKPLGSNAKMAPPGAFVDSVLRAGEANCNVAATTLWLSDLRGLPEKGGGSTPIGSKDMGAVTGYMNNPGNGQHVLSSKEGHMALVSRKGEIIDATPPGSGGSAEETQEPGIAKSPLEPWMFIPGVVALGALGYSRRRQLLGIALRAKNSVLHQRSQRAASALLAMDTSSLQLALNLAESYLYSGQPFGVGQSYSRVARYPERDKRKLVESLLKPHYNNKFVRKALASQPNVPPTVRRAYRLAAKVKR